MLSGRLSAALFNRTGRFVTAISLEEEFCAFAAAQAAHRISIPSQSFLPPVLLTDGKVYRPHIHFEFPNSNFEINWSPSSFRSIAFPIFDLRLRQAANLKIAIQIQKSTKLGVAWAAGSRCAESVSYRESSSPGCPHLRSLGSLTRGHRLDPSRALRTGAFRLHALSWRLHKLPAARRREFLFANRESRARRTTTAQPDFPPDR